MAEVRLLLCVVSRQITVTLHDVRLMNLEMWNIWFCIISVINVLCFFGDTFNTMQIIILATGYYHFIQKISHFKRVRVKVKGLSDRT